MPAVPTEIAMLHLRIDDDSPEKMLIQGYLDAAEDIAMQYLNRRFYADSDALARASEAGTAGARPIVINPGITVAVLIILTCVYENRGNAPSEGVPEAALRFLDPWRVYT